MTIRFSSDARRPLSVTAAQPAAICLFNCVTFTRAFYRRRKNRRLISYGGGDNIATSRPLTTEEELRRWGRGATAIQPARVAGPVAHRVQSSSSTFNAHRTVRPGPPTSECLASRLATATKDFMNIDIGHRSGDRPTRLFEWQSGASSADSYPSAPPAAQCQPFTRPAESTGYSRNMESRRPEDFEVE